LKKLIYIIMICGFVSNSFAGDKNKLNTEKDFIKSLRLAMAKKDEKSLNKIALEIEKYYCCLPGYEKGYIAIRKTSFLLEQGKYQQAGNFINVLPK